MPYCKKTADEMLLGLLYDPEELCFPDFEILDDEKASQVMEPEKCVDGCSYIEMINLNGKSCFLLNRLQNLTESRREARFALWWLRRNGQLSREFGRKMLVLGRQLRQ
jgi:hypothetical protein